MACRNQRERSHLQADSSWQGKEAEKGEGHCLERVGSPSENRISLDFGCDSIGVPGPELPTDPLGVSGGEKSARGGGAGPGDRPLPRRPHPAGGGPRWPCCGRASQLQSLVGRPWR